MNRLGSYSCLYVRASARVYVCGCSKIILYAIINFLIMCGTGIQLAIKKNVLFCKNNLKD